MCGIVGIYLKKKNLHDKLGLYLSGMLDNMSTRGPDSAGFAIYNNKKLKVYKYSLCIPFDYKTKEVEKKNEELMREHKYLKEKIKKLQLEVMKKSELEDKFNQDIEELTQETENLVSEIDKWQM